MPKEAAGVAVAPQVCNWNRIGDRNRDRRLNSMTLIKAFNRRFFVWFQSGKLVGLLLGSSSVII